MALVVNTKDEESIEDLSPDQRHWVYNGLDCCITLTLKENMEPYMNDMAKKVYRRSTNLQAPFMEMMLRGLKTDVQLRESVRAELAEEYAQLTEQLNRLYNEVFDADCGTSATSHVQVKNLLYGILNIPEIKKRNSNGVMAPASDRETLERIGHEYLVARPFVNHILAIRDKSKALGFLKTPIDDDGHIRCNFNITGTNTGRQSSSISDFGTGTNLQNVSGALRNMFVAERGRKFVEIDLEQADSRNVGALAWNLFYESHGPEFAGAYLDACESGDLHTTVCRMAWGDLDWGDDSSLWRSVADSIAYRELSYRDLAKKLGHGTNYLGQPFTMAMHTKVAAGIIESFQSAYFGAFPCVKEWQDWTIDQLQSKQYLENLYGRGRNFFGKVTDQPVINAAIAYAPQGSTGEEINEGIMNLWQHADGKWFNLLVQVHDSILFDIPEEAEDDLVPLALEVMPARIQLAGDREFFVPLDAATGWNWGKQKFDKATGKIKNHYGMKGWSGHDSRSSFHKLNRQLSVRKLL